MRPRQEPTFEVNVPRALGGDGAKVAKLVEPWFGRPLPWQRHVLDAMLAKDGREYALMELGISVPRQNGKSWSVRARCFYGALRGERVLYTCHHGDTADEMFQALSAPFDDPDEPELRAFLRHVRKANGKQSIELQNGGRIRFVTRTDSGGRGTGYDVLIIDEAQEFTESQQAALIPTTSASAKGNPQTIYLGTPPDPKRAATVFRSLHAGAHSGKSAMPWMEWAATEVGDPSDKARWYETNPSLGEVLLLRSVESEARQMAPDTFARERLGWWSPTESFKPLAIDAGKWAACRVGDAPPEDSGRLAFGVKFSPDGSRVAVSWALADAGEDSYVELYEVAGAAGGTAWPSEMLLRNQDGIAEVLIDGKSGASSLVQRLRDGGFPAKAIVEGSPRVVQAAAAMLVAEVNDGTVHHVESPALDDSATKSIRRDIGQDGFGFGDGADSMACPVESASLALYAARTTRRDQRREQRASF